MLALTLFGVFFAIALAGVPLLFAILITTTGIIGLQGLGHPLETIFLSFIGGVEPFILLAVPLFIFAGELLAQGGVGKRIVEFARVLFGWLPGGLGVVTVISCTLFGGVSGSAIADTAAIGSLVIPAMVARGYSRGFAAALLAVAGTIALLMPLSIPFLIYAFISGVSMRTLSMAGLLPALATALALIVVCMWHGKRSGVDNGDERSTPAQIWAATKDAGPALLMPLIIIGGIWSGLFTPSESAAIAVFYGLAVSLFYYKDLHWRRMPQLLLNAFVTSATVMLVIGATGAMAWLITVEQVAQQMADWIQIVATAAVDVPAAVQRVPAAAGHLHRAAAGDAAERAAVPAAGQALRHGHGACRRDDDGQPGDRAVHAAGGWHTVRRGQAGQGGHRRDHAPPVAADDRHLQRGAADHVLSATVAVAATADSILVTAMLALVVEFRIHSAHIEAFDAAIRANAQASVDTEPGCRQFDVCRDPDQPQLFFLYELYDDDAAIQAHLQSPHYLQMNAATAAWVEGKTVRKLQRVQP